MFMTFGPLPVQQFLVVFISAVAFLPEGTMAKSSATTWAPTTMPTEMPTRRPRPKRTTEPTPSPTWRPRSEAQDGAFFVENAQSEMGTAIGGAAVFSSTRLMASVLVAALLVLCYVAYCLVKKRGTKKTAVYGTWGNDEETAPTIVTPVIS